MAFDSKFDVILNPLNVKDWKNSRNQILTSIYNQSAICLNSVIKLALHSNETCVEILKLQKVFFEVNSSM